MGTLHNKMIEEESDNFRIDIVRELVGLDPEDILTERYEDEFILNKRTETIGRSAEEAIQIVEELLHYLREAFKKGKLPIALNTLGHPDEWTTEKMGDAKWVATDRNTIYSAVETAIRELYPIGITNFSIEEILLAWNSIFYYKAAVGYHTESFIQAFNHVKVEDTRKVITLHDGVYWVIDDNTAYDVAYEEASEYYSNQISEDIPSGYESWVDYDGYVRDMCQDLDISEWLDRRSVDGDNVWYSKQAIDGTYWWVVQIE